MIAPIDPAKIIENSASPIVITKKPKPKRFFLKFFKRSSQNSRALYISKGIIGARYKPTAFGYSKIEVARRVAKARQYSFGIVFGKK